MTFLVESAADWAFEPATDWRQFAHSHQPEKREPHYKTEKRKQPIGAESRTCSRRKTLRTLQNTKTRRQKIHRTLNARHRNTKTHQTNRCKNHTMTNATCPKLKAHAGDDLDCSGSSRPHCRLKYKILQTTNRRRLNATPRPQIIQETPKSFLKKNV